MLDKTPTIALQVPERLFQRLERMAKRTHRTVEDVLISTMNVALAQDANLPAELADELAAMAMFKDDELWAASATSMSPSQQRRLYQLAEMPEERPLTSAEESELQELLECHDWALLRRARALAILAQRGYELPDRTDLATNDEQSL